MYKVFCYPRCGTCKKAISYLEERDVEFQYIDIVQNPPTEKELKSFFSKSGYPLKKFFNTSGMKYRDMNLKEKIPNMSEEEIFRLLSGEGMLIKRPLLTDGKDLILVGFRQAEWDQKIK